MLVWLVTTALATTGLVTMNSTPASAATRTISGHVVDSVTGQPISDAVVHAAAQTTTTHTTASGDFTLTDVPNDALAVIGAKQGYGFRWQPLTQGGDSTTLRLDPQDAGDPHSPGTVPHPEYPRPDADHRAANGGQWLSLNGTWSFDFDPADSGVAQNWAGGGHAWTNAVNLPFSYTSLAGVGEQQRASNAVYGSQFANTRGTVWYQRNLTMPADWPTDRDALLRFGAVDWHTTVYLDGTQLAEHDGGYTPFDIRLGGLRPGSTHSLVVRAVVPDNSDRTPYPQGKQMGWYTDTGGIWQSVWLEPATSTRLDTVHVTPQLSFQGSTPTSTGATVDVHATGATTGTVRLEVREQTGQPGFTSRPTANGPDLPTPQEPQPGRVVATAEVALTNGTGSTTLSIPDGRLWTPETPWLYQLRATVGEPINGHIGEPINGQSGEPINGQSGGVATPQDSVDTWFGLRTIAREWAPGRSPAEQADPKQQYQYLYLNNRPIYLRSTLDQAFNPWGVYSYTGLYQGSDLRSGQLDDPRKGSVLFDIALTKQLGLNSVREHIKVNDPLYYHWADVAGLMVWYDQPNFGYHGFSPQAKQLWEGNLRAAVQRDYNHPSIVVWDDFNEGWGFGNPGAAIQSDAIPWVQEMTGLTKDLTRGTRLVVDNSPCCDNGHVSDLTDTNDFHGYYSSFDEWQHVVENEAANAYPGSSFNFQQGKQSGQPLLNSEFGPWSGGREKDQEVATPFRYTAELFRKQPKLAGYLFTELTDVEFEWNGWSAYDRTLQVPGYLTADGRQGGVPLADTDDVLAVRARPVQRITPGTELTLPVTASLFSGRDVDGSSLRWRISGTDATGTPLPEQPWQQKTVTPQRFTAADLGTVSAAVPAQLVAGRLDLQLVRGGTVLAGGQTFLASWTGQQPSTVDDSRTVVGLDPAAAQSKWPQGSSTFQQNGASAVAGVGDGEFQWTAQVPPQLANGSWQHAQLVLEAGAAHPNLPRTNYPQTSERRYPTTLQATVNGVAANAVTLPDDPADARGFLSEESGYAPGKYGFRVVLDLDADRLRQSMHDGELTVTLGGVGGGLTVFGPRTGRYGITPQVVFSQVNPVPGSGVQPAEPYVGTTEGGGVNSYLVPGHPAAGQPGTMTVAVVNDSHQPIRQVAPELLVPEGWHAQPQGAFDGGTLPPGAARYLRFTVTPDNALTPVLRTRVRYTDATGPQVAEMPWNLAGPTG